MCKWDSNIKIKNPSVYVYESVWYLIIEEYYTTHTSDMEHLKLDLHKSAS